MADPHDGQVIEGSHVCTAVPIASLPWGSKQDFDTTFSFDYLVNFPVGIHFDFNSSKIQMKVLPEWLPT